MQQEFDLEYIKKDNRVKWDDSYPEWQNIINEIRNTISYTMEQLYQLIPNYCNHSESFMDFEGTPFQIAAAEISISYKLPGDLDDTEFQIDTETNEITLREYE